MKKKIRLATVFSGIGAPEQALLNLGCKLEIVFACDNGERELAQSSDQIKEMISKMTKKDAKKYINNLYNQTGKHNYVKDAYFENYSISEERWYEDVRFLDGNPFKNKVDLFVGGSPCQSFSIIGKRKGLEDTRGTLFYDFARLIKEIQPKVFVYENVPGMLTHDGGETWETIKNVFETLNYSIHYKLLNSLDFGIPQDRNRLFVVGFKKEKNFSFPQPIPLTTNMFDFLERRVNPKHYLGEKGFKFVTSPKYRNRARINSKIIQTQKANQQFNWNGDFIFEPLDTLKNKKAILSRAYVGQWKGQKGVIRQLSCRECMRLMGFPDTYEIVVPSTPAYRQAGNSIVVNVLEHLFKSIYE